MSKTGNSRSVLVLAYSDPPPRAPTNGRPGFLFGFLGAGGRLPKARRELVFFVFFLWSLCILTSQMEAFVFHQEKRRGFYFTAVRKLQKADPQPRTQNHRRTSQQGRPAGPKQPGINHHNRCASANAGAGGLPAQSQNTRDGHRMRRSAQTGSKTQDHNDGMIILIGVMVES